VLKLYGSKISYYTGKMEAYLRYREIPFEFVTVNRALFRMLLKNTGTSQIPAIELPDGRFLTDTTPSIEFLEGEFEPHPVIPTDPVQRFVSKLLEDYAEEWLWRPAMHFRWSYPAGRSLLGRKIVDEIMTDVPIPGVLKRAMIRYRQHEFYVNRDGVSNETWDHVEHIYLDTLDRLEAVFQRRPFLFGERPTLADFGFFAPMFRHFSQDPTPSDIMRDRAPAVFEWQARLWNRRGGAGGKLVTGIPTDLEPFLVDAGNTYLPYLNDNARAWKQRAERLDFEVEGVRYEGVPVSQYRVWCLQMLRAEFDDLAPNARAEVRALLERTGSWTSFTDLEDVESGYDENNAPPFRGRKVHYDNDK